MSRNEGGYTLPELIIVVTLITFLSTLIFGFSINYWAYGYKLETDLTTLDTRLNVGDFLRENVGTSTGLIIQNSIPDSHVLNADPNYSPANYWLAIHAIPGNKPVGNSGSYTPVFYYERPSLNLTNNYIMNGTQPYNDEYILYLDGSTKSLMLRTLANPSATGNRAITSCPPSLATASCPADKTLATNVSSVDVRYFSRTGNTIDWTSIFNTDTNTYVGPDFPAVEVVELKLNLSAKAKLQQGNSETSSTVIRIALRNA